MIKRRRIEPFIALALDLFFKTEYIVLSNHRSSFPSDYCGWFSSVTLTYKGNTVSGAWSKNGKIKIGSVCLGLSFSLSPKLLGFSQTYYIQISGNNALRNNFSALKKSIDDKMAWFKLFAVFY